jgi:uncharacterized membrane protein
MPSGGASTGKTAGRISTAIALLSCAGIVVSAVSLYHHYGSSKSSFCDFGNSFNCDMVNRSIYSTVAGIPVALLGVLGYAVLLCLSSVYRTKAETPVIFLIVSVVGLSFALYLTYVEASVLAVWCVLCLSSLGLIALITGLSVLLVARSRHST